MPWRWRSNATRRRARRWPGPGGNWRHMATAGSTISTWRNRWSASTSPRRSRSTQGRPAVGHGWYQGRCSPNTCRLVAEEGGFVYNADSYADDLPYWDTSTGKPQLIVPYAFDSNDMRFATPQGSVLYL